MGQKAVSYTHLDVYKRQTYCIGGAIVGEWLSASAGLGYYMIRVKNGYMLDKVFACVIVIIFWSLLLHLAVTLLERIVFPYKR